MSLAGKTAVVTGAAGNMGLAVVRALLEEGAQVALVDLDALRLDSLIRFLRGNTVAVSCDVGEPGAVRQSHQQVEKVFGPVDILVNAASQSTGERVEATSDDEWRRLMAANLDGAFYWSRAVIPAMKKRGWGRIVNIASLAGKTGGAEGAGTAYAASKGALAALTFALARETAPHGITVNAVAPAFVKTSGAGDEMNDAQRRQLLAQIPVGRFCEPEELGHAIRFFVSPLAGFVTGEVLDLNGGLHMD
jgi:3-oxoacyl-[acyl-carrier protein] reductase